MSEVNMIDTLGYGIHAMTKSQRNRYLPLPDYRRSTSATVVLEVLGRPIDERYSQLLLERHDLEIDTVILLDRVQKGLPITESAAAKLRSAKLVTGRRPNLRVSASLSESREDELLEKDQIQSLIIAHLKREKSASRDQIEKLVTPRLPSHLTDKQKGDRVKNLLSAMRRAGLIRPDKAARGAVWQIV